jgi:hypothetical protein
LKGDYLFTGSKTARNRTLEQSGEKRQAKYPLIYKSLNYRLRKVSRKRSILAGDGAVYKIMYPALSNAAKNGPYRLRIGAPLSTSLHCFLAELTTFAKNNTMKSISALNTKKQRNRRWNAGIRSKE